KDVEVLVIGGGASGSMAGIQSARMGAKTLIVEEGPWLGGMLTSAGVSAIDGNHELHSGLWNEFRQKLHDYYGGPDSVNTGWVSHVLFEPSVGEKIIRDMTMAESNLDVIFKYSLKSIKKTNSGWEAIFNNRTNEFTVTADVVIDGTELGDVAKMVGIPYDIGMDSRSETGEDIAPEEANDIVQDMTYVVVLKDYGEGVNKTIPCPENYDPSPFLCTCQGFCDQDTIVRTLWPCDEMIEYGKLPNGKYMINWPIYGNDYYLNVVEMSPEERRHEYEEAKWFTRCYIYYMQTELGFKHLGIAENEFPTEDGFPLIPYHRESLRIKGTVRFTINDLARPFQQETALYRTGVAVGDYPVDHHHAAYPDQSQVPDLHFYPVPSYSLPLGTLIPRHTKNFIVAEKSISVTNIVNGTTRLQPVCILIGQAAGTLAALAVRQEVTPVDVPVRDVQSQLLAGGAYLMPYSDVAPENRAWEDVQKIGATGIIKGEGKNVGWTTLTLFHADSVMTASALEEGIIALAPEFMCQSDTNIMTVEDGVRSAYWLAHYLNPDGIVDSQLEHAREIWAEAGLGTFDPVQPITRLLMDVLLNRIANPFSLAGVDQEGTFVHNR
ncbi:MAG: FAD-dependent oxidoreductase, partial [Spirochaetales bacterium]|nr:FAD-dependent oxidoreductase [Spirochaetales bacterium]